MMMSAATAQKFLELLSSNPGVQTQFRVADPRSLDKLLDFAHGKGFIFTAEDLETALKDAPAGPLADWLRERVKRRA
jgi:predicted ribosomally synthesized peptide with nif11-like leader